MRFYVTLLATIVCTAYGLTACSHSGDVQEVAPQSMSDAITTTALVAEQEDKSLSINSIDNINMAQAATDNKTPATSDKAKDNVYRVAIGPNHPPFEYRQADGSLTGFDIELLLAVAEQAGFKVEFRTYPKLLDVFNSVEQGKTDIGVAAIVINPKYRKKLSYSHSYFSMPLYLTGLKYNGYPTSIGEVKGNTIAVQRNTAMADIVQRKFVPMGNKTLRYNTSFLAFKSLFSQQTDLMLDSITTINGLSRHAKNDELFFIRLPNQYTLQLRYISAKGNNDVIHKLNVGIEGIKTNGKYAQIYNKWFSDINKNLLQHELDAGQNSP